MVLRTTCWFSAQWVAPGRVIRLISRIVLSVVSGGQALDLAAF